MTSRLVLGGATYGMKTQAEVNRLIGTALDSGITRIDTANGYEGSEKRIGAFLANGRELIINSKIGLPNPSEFTPKGIRQSVETSLTRLGIERLGTLFVHSLNSDYLTQNNIEAMELLREQGKVTKIGYAGDGSNLRAAIGIPSFDDFMATFNIIDQSNSDDIRKIAPACDVYFKLAMGQAVWTSLEWKRRLKSSKILRTMFNKPPEPDSWIDYCQRFAQFKPKMSTKNFPESFLNFALHSGTSKQYVILGTHNHKHILEAVEIEQKGLNEYNSEVTKYENLWLENRTPNWEAHSG